AGAAAGTASRTASDNVRIRVSTFGSAPAALLEQVPVEILRVQLRAVRQRQVLEVHDLRPVARRVALYGHAVARRDLVAVPTLPQQHGARTAFRHPLLDDPAVVDVEINSEVRIAEPVLGDRALHRDLPAEIIEHRRRVMSARLRRKRNGRERQGQDRLRMLSVHHSRSSAVSSSGPARSVTKADRHASAASDHSATRTIPSRKPGACPKALAPASPPRAKEFFPHKLAQQSIQIVSPSGGSLSAGRPPAITGP